MHRDKKEHGGCRGWRGKRESLFNGDGVSVVQDEKFWGSFHKVDVLNTTELYMKMVTITSGPIPLKNTHYNGVTEYLFR